MITIGVDVHKATHTFVAVDGVGRKLGDKTVAATGQGHQQAQLWASTLAGDGPVLWAVEDCRTMSNRLERDLLADITALTERVKALTTRITDTVTPVPETVQKIVGCAALTAARILGETANITRFDSSDKYARYCGVAPVPVGSGRTAGHVRMTRSGNRQLNQAIHTIAMTQARIDGTTGRTYYLKKLGEGKTKKEALRCLKRQIARKRVPSTANRSPQHRKITRKSRRLT